MAVSLNLLKQLSFRTGILIVASPIDVPTRYGSYYLQQLARQLGATIILNPNLKRFAAYLRSLDPDLVIINGHGGSKGVEGGGRHIIVGIPSYDEELNVKIYHSNAEWFKGRIVYLFTCWSGKTLAPALRMAGADVVVAYRSAFLFLAEDHENPEADRLAEPFFRAALTFPLQLAKNKTAYEAFSAMGEAFHQEVVKAEMEGDKTRAKLLYHDMRNLIFLGNPNRKLNSPLPQ